MSCGSIGGLAKRARVAHPIIPRCCNLATIFHPDVLYNSPIMLFDSPIMLLISPQKFYIPQLKTWTDNLKHELQDMYCKTDRNFNVVVSWDECKCIFVVTLFVLCISVLFLYIYSVCWIISQFPQVLSVPVDLKCIRHYKRHNIIMQP